MGNFHSRIGRTSFGWVCDVLYCKQVWACGYRYLHRCRNVCSYKFPNGYDDQNKLLKEASEAKVGKTEKRKLFGYPYAHALSCDSSQRPLKTDWHANLWNSNDHRNWRKGDDKKYKRIEYKLKFEPYNVQSKRKVFQFEKSRAKHFNGMPIFWYLKWQTMSQKHRWVSCCVLFIHSTFSLALSLTPALCRSYANLADIREKFSQVEWDNEFHYRFAEYCRFFF